MKAAVVLLMGVAACAADAAIYKCDDGKGGVVYGNTPCGDNSPPLDIQSNPAGPTDGLRPSEREFLEDLGNREKAQREPPPPAPPPDLAPPFNPRASRCAGLEVIDYSVFERPTVPVFPSTDRVVVLPRGLAYLERCATVTFQAPGYNNRLVDSAAEDIAGRLQAELAYGGGAVARTGSIKSSSFRLSGRETYTGEFCFGYTEAPIVTLRCR